MTNITSFTVFVCYGFFLVLLAWFFVELLQSFGIFFFAKCRGRLIHRYSRTCNFLAKKQGVDLYTGSTYTPENTVNILACHKFAVQRFVVLPVCGKCHRI